MTAKHIRKGLRFLRTRQIARTAVLSALWLAALPIFDVLIAPASIITLAQARDRDDDAERNMREAQRQFKEAEERRREAEERRREAEEQRREAAENSRRMQEQARERQRQAEESQRESARRAHQQQAEQARQTPRRESEQIPANRRSDDAWRNSSKGDDNKNNRKSDAPDKSESSEKSGTSQSEKDSDKSDKTDKAEKADKTDKADKSKKADDLPEGPPATVEQWLKQAFTPKPAVEDRENERPRRGRDDRDDISDAGRATRGDKQAGEAPVPGKLEPSKTDPAKPADVKKTDVPKPAGPKTAGNTKPADPKQGKGGGGVGAIDLPDVRLPEVLAVNASRQTLEKAKELGFKAKSPTSLSHLDLAVTQLLPPEGMNAFEAQALLKRAMPSASFAPNQVYRIYKTASSTKTLPAGTRAATLTPGAMACGDDRCFGRDIIGWKPELRSCVSGVKIGVIDTSIDTTHPAFAKKSLELKHFGKEGARGPDWHGTGIAALLAGDAASGTPGLIPDASFYVADIFHAGADDEPASDTVSMLRAFDWLEAKGVKVINMSLSGPPDELIRAAVQKLSAKGILLVAAAGNEGPYADPSYPAAYEQVIAVTAVNKDLQNYRHANRGSYIDVAAPGVSIWTALPGAQGGYHSGTSFATPYVTAALAAIYPRLANKTQSEAMQLISYKDLGEPGIDPVYGHGLLVAPVTCGTGLVADGPARASGKSGLTNSSPAVSAAPSPAEILPWLGFQNSSN